MTDTPRPAPPPTPTTIPTSSLILGFGPMALLPLAAVAAWMANPWWAAAIVSGGQLWASVLLIFIAGVRRGYGFSLDDGARAIVIATVIWLFLLGLAGVVLPWVTAFSMLIVGYGSVAMLDPPAARRGEVPAHFAKLRPPQMAVALIGLAGLLARGLGLGHNM